MTDMSAYQPEVGDFVHPDDWHFGELLKEDDGFKDSSFPGCQFRLPSTGGELAVNVTVTSRKSRYCSGSYGWVRVKIEFVGDGEESSFTGGWMRKTS